MQAITLKCPAAVPSAETEHENPIDALVLMCSIIEQCLNVARPLVKRGIVPASRGCGLTGLFMGQRMQSVMRPAAAHGTPAVRATAAGPLKQPGSVPGLGRRAVMQQDYITAGEPVRKATQHRGRSSAESSPRLVQET